MSGFQILIDSDAFVSRFFSRDENHQRSLEYFSYLKQHRLNFMTSSMVIDEVATVLSKRSGQDLAREFLTAIDEAQVPVVFVDEDLHDAGLTLFAKQEKRGSSVTDVVNVVLMKHLSIPRIFAFDQVYHRSFKLQNIVYQ